MILCKTALDEGKTAVSVLQGWGSPHAVRGATCTQSSAIGGSGGAPRFQFLPACVQAFHVLLRFLQCSAGVGQDYMVGADGLILRLAAAIEAQAFWSDRRPAL